MTKVPIPAYNNRVNWKVRRGISAIPASDQPHADTLPPRGHSTLPCDRRGNLTLYLLKFHAIHNLPPGDVAHGTVCNDISETDTALQSSLTDFKAADNAPQA